MIVWPVVTLKSVRSAAWTCPSTSLPNAKLTPRPSTNSTEPDDGRRRQVPAGAAAAARAAAQALPPASCRVVAVQARAERSSDGPVPFADGRPRGVRAVLDEVVDDHRRGPAGRVLGRARPGELDRLAAVVERHPGSSRRSAIVAGISLSVRNAAASPSTTSRYAPGASMRARGERQLEAVGEPPPGSGRRCGSSGCRARGNSLRACRSGGT